MKTWTKVTAVLPSVPDDWSVWAERFSRFGLEGTVQTDDPPTLSAYVPPGDSIEGLSDNLIGHGARVVTEKVEDIDWSIAWRDFFKPVAVGERLWIRPTWEDVRPPRGRVEIVLDPGQAFGTGDHPTTRLCLAMVEQVVKPGDVVADIGCGSGILSVAAMKLGAASVDAVDMDSLSVETTRENALLNKVKVRAYEGLGFDPLGPCQYDLVVSNIISAAVIGLCHEASERTKNGGAWIVSGIIEPNWQDVYAAVTQCGFQVENWQKEGDWVAAILRR